MKSIILSMMAAATICCAPLNAQNGSTNDSREIPQEELINKRIQRMEQRLALDEKASAEFAPLYKEYLEELEACYTASNDTKSANMTEDEKEQQIQKRFQLRQWILDTQIEYYAKFKEFLNTEQLEYIFNNTERFGRNDKACMHKAMAQKCEKKGNCRH